MTNFEETYPELAKFWLDPANSFTQLAFAKRQECSILYECWDKVAKRLLNQLWRVNSSKIFHEPVNAEKLNIPDYFEVIKNPTDFSTIKQRLDSNMYHSLQEFLDDIELCFDNCMTYNGEDSQVGKMCNKVRDEFKKLYEQLNVEFYLKA